MKLGRMGRALRHRNYRLFFAGQGTSLIGTWLTKFAMSYATYELSHSEWQLGLVAFASQAPTAIIAPVAGVLVDRWDRHKTLVVTQIAALAQSAALAAFALSGALSVWVLLVLGAVQAVINAFDMPARQSFVRQMVDDRADLPNAIALNSLLVNSARLVGPVIAAVLVDWLGFGGCFTLDAASYLAVIGSLLAMRVPKQLVKRSDRRIAHDLKDGLRYVYGLREVRALLLLLATTACFGGAYSALLPAVAAEQYGNGPHTLGILMAATGLGAIAGTLHLASIEGMDGLRRVVANRALGLGVGLAALELAPSIWTAVPVLFVVGACLMVQWSATNTLVQTLVDDDKLGRVMSLYALVFFTGAPVGALLEGAAATYIGATHTLALAGGACVVGALALRGSVLSSATASTPPSARNT